MDIIRWEHLTPREKVERWSRAVDVIAGLSEHEIEHHFNMSTWGYNTDCGTVGCAAGLIAEDPGFQAEGFKRHYFTHLGKSDGYWLRTNPRDFFGTYAFRKIFNNDQFTCAVNPKGKDMHGRVLLAMKDYLEELKGDAACS